MRLDLLTLGCCEWLARVVKPLRMSLHSCQSSLHHTYAANSLGILSINGLITPANYIRV